jgi:hypothetical protein
MLKILLLTLLMLMGLASPLLIPRGIASSGRLDLLLHIATMTALAFIMIRVGYDLDIDKRRPGIYAYDYWVAMTAAALPWLFCTLYFVFIMATKDSGSGRWMPMMLLSRFAAPTSAGVLFSMLTAAGLGTTWVFRQARILAIFDDIDTILVVVLLQIVMAGHLVWKLGLMIGAVLLLLCVTWRYLHTVRLRVTWRWMLMYAIALACACEGLSSLSRRYSQGIPLPVEVLLPAFFLGAMLARPPAGCAHPGEGSAETRVTNIVTASFMFLAGASISTIDTHAPLGSLADAQQSLKAVGPDVLALTFLSNLGKMFPAFCYRHKTGQDVRAAGAGRSLRERLALGVCMFPRGEVGAGVLVIASAPAYAVSAAARNAASLSLVLNLICSGLFIVLVKWLVTGSVSKLDSQASSRSI